MGKLVGDQIGVLVLVLCQPPSKEFAAILEHTLFLQTAGLPFCYLLCYLSGYQFTHPDTPLRMVLI